MIYLLLAIASSAMVSICMRLSEKHVKNEMGMFMANYAVCIALSYGFMNHALSVSAERSVLIMWLLGVISGILYLVSFVAMKINMKYNGIVLASTFMKLGILIPTVMAVLVFREVPKVTQLAGIGFAIAAIVIINFEKGSSGESLKKIWLIGLLVLSGFTDAMANIYEQIGSSALKDDYLLVTFIFAFIFAVIFTVRDKVKVSVKDILFGMLIGIPNYFSARFLLLALGSVKAVLVYPMYSVATIIVVTLAGLTFFGEKLSRKKMFALSLIGIALCLMNI